MQNILGLTVEIAISKESNFFYNKRMLQKLVNKIFFYQYNLNIYMNINIFFINIIKVSTFFKLQLLLNTL